MPTNRETENYTRNESTKYRLLQYSVCLFITNDSVEKIETGRPCSAGELCLDVNAACTNGVCLCSALHYLSLVNESQCRQ